MDSGHPSHPHREGDKSAAAPQPLPRSEEIPAHESEPVIFDATGEVVKHEEKEAAIKAAEAYQKIDTKQGAILDRIKTGERWMILFTAIVALTTIYQAIQSGCNNANTSRQVEKIIGAANTQASAANKIAGA